MSLVVYRRCRRCRLPKLMGLGRRRCDECRRVDRRAAYRERCRLVRAFIHDGGERDCRCDICYLRRQPLTMFQFGLLSRVTLH